MGPVRRRRKSGGERARFLRLQAWQVCHGRRKAGDCGGESAEQGEGSAILESEILEKPISHFLNATKGEADLPIHSGLKTFPCSLLAGTQKNTWCPDRS